MYPFSVRRGFDTEVAAVLFADCEAADAVPTPGHVQAFDLLEPTDRLRRYASGPSTAAAFCLRALEAPERKNVGMDAEMRAGMDREPINNHDPSPGAPGAASHGTGGGAKRNSLLDELQELKTVRDEIRLQIHVGRAEAREKFQDLEDRWVELSQKIPGLKTVENNVAEWARGIEHISQKFVDELKDGYRSLRKTLSENPVDGGSTRSGQRQ